MTACIARSPATALLAALFALGGGKAELVSHAERRWASTTFTGTRHQVELVFAGIEAGVAGEAMIEVLPEHEFTITGQIVADCAVIAVERVARPLQLRFTAELLLIEDR